LKATFFKLTLILISLLLGACSTTLKPPTLGKSGHFETNKIIAPSSIKVKKAFRPEYRRMIYVKTDEKNERFNAFFLESFRNMGQFEKVLSKEEMEKLVFDKNLTDKVLSISDKVGLHNLQKEIGPFLVVEPYADWLGGYIFMARLKAYDPKTGKDILVLENEAFNWSGLDKPLFYPLLNAFLQWSRGEAIQTTQASTKDHPTH
jgi:hypothetical protein